MARNPEITPDVLLAHAGFVRSLARQLLADEALVEDVVQETFVRALQTGPRHREALVAWLRSVTRNVAFKAMRTSRRRIRRERAAARDEGLPSTTDLVSREQSLKSVVDAVLELPEHYRQVVMLRFFDDLPPRKIAVRLDLPVNTVRMRLHRALKQLRGKLDREYGEPGAWCPGVALLAGVARPAAAPSASLSSQVVIGTAAAVVTCAALLFAWMRSGGAAETEVTAIAHPAPAPGAEGPDGTDDESALVAETERGRREELAGREVLPAPEVGGADVAQSSFTSIASILVVDPAGAPVANATVFGERRPDTLRMAGRTGPDGSFSIDVGAERAEKARGGALAVVFGARRDGYAPSAVVPWRGESDVVRIVLRPGGAELSGRVQDPTGAAIAGVRIVVGESYRLGTSFLGAQVMADEPGPGRLMAARLGVPGRTALIQRIEHGRGYLGGMALSEGGELHRLLPPVEVVTDAAGAWRASGLEPGPTPVRIAAPGFAPRAMTIELAPHGARTLDVELEPGASLVGQARREDGLTPGESFVYVIGDENGVRRSARIAGDGRFALEDMPAGRVRLFAESRTGALVTHSAATELELAAGAESTWDALLTPREIVLGELADAANRPLAGWIVQIRLHENPSNAIAEATTDAEGHFALQARPPFPAGVYVYPPGPRAVHPSRVVRDVWEGAERHVIRLTPDESLVGSIAGSLRAREGDSLEPLLRVLLVPEGSRHVFSLGCDEDGVFGTGGMPGGRYWLALPAHGIGWVREPWIDLAPGLSLDLGEVKLPELGRLHLFGASDDAGLRLRLSLVASGGFRLVLFEGRAQVPLEIEAAPGTYAIERLDATGSGAKPLEALVRPGETTRANLSLLR